MKVLYKNEIDGYSVISIITNAAVDSEATKEKIAPLLTPEMEEKDVQELYMKNLVYAKPGPEAELLEDKEAEKLQKKLDEKGTRGLLLENGEYVADYRNVEFWNKNKKSGEWIKDKIEKLGIDLPASAVLQENLSQEQQAEISIQQEKARIAALSPEEKIKEEKSKLDAIAQEAIRKAEAAELTGEAFDKVEWFQSQKAEIVKLYKN